MRPVGSCRWNKKPHPDHIYQNFLQRLTVLLIQPKQHERRCQSNQKKEGKVAAKGIAEQEIGTYTTYTRQRETQNLSFGQTKGNLVLDLRQVFGNEYISQCETSFR